MGVISLLTWYSTFLKLSRLHGNNSNYSKNENYATRYPFRKIVCLEVIKPTFYTLNDFLHQKSHPRLRCTVNLFVNLVQMNALYVVSRWTGFRKTAHIAK